MQTESSYLFTCRSTGKTYSWFYAQRSQNCESLSLSQHMLLSALFTYGVGPVLHVDSLSHFSHVCSGKKIKNRIYMQKIICRTNLLCDQPIFVAQSGRRRCAWLSKIF